jgi:hypothetical protein
VSVRHQGRTYLLNLVPCAAEAAFGKAEYDWRMKRLRENMSAKGFDLFLTSGPSFRKLSGIGWSATWTSTSHQLRTAEGTGSVSISADTFSFWRTLAFESVKHGG